MKFLFILIFLVLPLNAYTHGLTSASAKIELRPGNLVELKVQFNFIDLLNHQSKNFSLAVIAALSQEKFGLLYQEVRKLFKKKLIVKKGAKRLEINRRFPSQSQMFHLIKREFIELKFNKKQKNVPYTFSDRRFYQVFYFDFRIASAKDLKELSISFPKELGSVYMTFVQSSNREIHKGEFWSYSDKQK